MKIQQQIKRPTQVEAIHKYLMDFGSITPLEALQDLGCFRLAARIHDLRKTGVAIDHELVSFRSKRTGKVVRHARYQLAETKPRGSFRLWEVGDE